MKGCKTFTVRMHIHRIGRFCLQNVPRSAHFSYQYNNNKKHSIYTQLFSIDIFLVKCSCISYVKQVCITVVYNIYWRLLKLVWTFVYLNKLMYTKWKRCILLYFQVGIFHWSCGFFRHLCVFKMSVTSTLYKYRSTFERFRLVIKVDVSERQSATGVGITTKHKPK